MVLLPLAAVQRARLLSPALLRLLADVGEDAAVHIQNLTVHKIGRVRGQKNSRALQIVGRAPPPRRRLADDERIKRMAAAVRLALPQGRRLRRGNVPGADAVAPDARILLYVDACSTGRGLNFPRRPPDPAFRLRSREQAGFGCMGAAA